MRLITLTAIDIEEDMFDEYLETQTETAEEIEQTFSIAGFNSVAIFNTYGIEASLTVDGVTQTISLIRDSIKDWWDYFFAPNRTGRDAVFYFPLQESGDATLVISYPGGTAKCGLCITGYYKEIANTKFDLEIGISDYSRIATDGFGQTYLAEGNWAKRASASLTLTNDKVDTTYREVIKNRATPCVFDYNEYSSSLGDTYTSEDGIQSLIVYGYTEDFSISIKSAMYSNAKHESQGLI